MRFVVARTRICFSQLPKSNRLKLNGYHIVDMKLATETFKKIWINLDNLTRIFETKIGFNLNREQLKNHLYQLLYRLEISRLQMTFEFLSNCTSNLVSNRCLFS